MTVTRGQLVTLERIALKDGWTVERTDAANALWVNPEGRRTHTRREANGSEFAQARHQLEQAGLIIPGRKPRNLSQVVDLTPKTQEETPVAVPKRELVGAIRAEADQIRSSVLETMHEEAIVKRVYERVAETIAQVAREAEAASQAELKLLTEGTAALEAMVNEVADQFKMFRDHQQDVLPPLRRDVQLLKDRPLVDAKTIIDAIGPYVGAELLKLRTQVDKDIQALRSDLETQMLTELLALEERLTAKIQNAAAAVDPLTAIRQRLGGK